MKAGQLSFFNSVEIPKTPNVTNQLEIRAVEEGNLYNFECWIVNILSCKAWLLKLLLSCDHLCLGNKRVSNGGAPK